MVRNKYLFQILGRIGTDIYIKSKDFNLVNVNGTYALYTRIKSIYGPYDETILANAISLEVGAVNSATCSFITTNWELNDKLDDIGRTRGYIYPVYVAGGTPNIPERKKIIVGIIWSPVDISKHCFVSIDGCYSLSLDDFEFLPYNLNIFEFMRLWPYDLGSKEAITNIICSNIVRAPIIGWEDEIC